MTTELPLFPLGSVLFPGVVLPLHIFEHRYRQLVRDLSALPEGAPRRFGVLAIKDGHEVGRGNVTALYDVGCTAEIDSIVEYEDGRFDITTTGVHRFRLEAFDDDGPYARGEVELLDEVAGPGGGGAGAGADRAVPQVPGARCRSCAGVQVGAIPELPEDPTVLSYLIGAATVLDTYEKQRLLTTRDDGRAAARRGEDPAAGDGDPEEPAVAAGGGSAAAAEPVGVRGSGRGRGVAHDLSRALSRQPSGVSACGAPEFAPGAAPGPSSPDRASGAGSHPGPAVLPRLLLVRQAAAPRSAHRRRRHAPGWNP